MILDVLSLPRHRREESYTRTGPKEITESMREGGSVAMERKVFYWIFLMGCLPETSVKGKTFQKCQKPIYVDKLGQL